MFRKNKKNPTTENGSSPKGKEPLHQLTNHASFPVNGASTSSPRSHILSRSLSGIFNGVRRKTTTPSESPRSPASSEPEVSPVALPRQVLFTNPETSLPASPVASSSSAEEGIEESCIYSLYLNDDVGPSAPPDKNPLDEVTELLDLYDSSSSVVIFLEEGESSSSQSTHKLPQNFKEYMASDPSIYRSVGASADLRKKNLAVKATIEDLKILPMDTLKKLQQAQVLIEMADITAKREEVFKSIVDDYLLPVLQEFNKHNKESSNLIAKMLCGADCKSEEKTEDEQLVMWDAEHEKFFLTLSKSLPENFSREFVKDRRKILNLGTDNIYRWVEKIFKENDIILEEIANYEGLKELFTYFIQINCQYIIKEFELANLSTKDNTIFVDGVKYFHQNQAARIYNSSKGIIGWAAKLTESISEKYTQAFRRQLRDALNNVTDEMTKKTLLRYFEWSNTDIYIESRFLKQLSNMGVADAIFNVCATTTKNPLIERTRSATFGR